MEGGMWHRFAAVVEKLLGNCIVPRKSDYERHVDGEKKQKNTVEEIYMLAVGIVPPQKS